MAGTSTSGADSDMVRRYNVARSCIRCHQRKIRCDKATPCAACVKAGDRSSCRYPADTKAKRRAVKADSLQLQVERLERLVADRTNQPPARNTNSAHQSSSSAAAVGVLVKDGHWVRYINDQVLSHILEKEVELRSAVATPLQETSSNQSPLGNMSLGTFLPGPSSTSSSSYSDIQQMLPPRWKAIELWQHYVSIVDPFIKVLHIPTAQPIIYAAIRDPENAAPDTHALLFAIFFAATTSKQHERADGSLELQLLDQYRRGTEICLNQADFLDHPTMDSLRAISIYLNIQRTFSSGRAIWAVNGLVIRAAQLIGLHKDGKTLGLSPFEAEMRRRLWWKTISADGRSLEDQGLSVYSDVHRSDTDFPLNIDDHDISPDSTSLPSESKGFTSMTITVVFSMVSLTAQRVGQLLAQNNPQSKSAVKEAIEEARTRIQSKYLQWCDLNIPIQRLICTAGMMVLDKIEFFSLHASLISKTGGGEPGIDEKDKAALEKACKILQVSNDLYGDEMMLNLKWNVCGFVQYQLLTYVLWWLCVRPNDPDIDKAWGVVLRNLEIMTDASRYQSIGPRWKILLMLKEKAERLRPAPSGAVTPGTTWNGSEQLLGDNVTLEEMMQAASGFEVNDPFWSEWLRFGQAENVPGSM